MTRPRPTRTKPKKASRPKDLRLRGYSYDGAFVFEWEDGVRRAYIDAPDISSGREARRLAKWLIQFAEWAESQK